MQRRRYLREINNKLMFYSTVLEILILISENTLVIFFATTLSPSQANVGGITLMPGPGTAGYTSIWSPPPSNTNFFAVTGLF